MKILEIEVFGRGGLTHYVYCLSRALAARGHDVVIATAADYELADTVRGEPRLRVEPSFSRLAKRLRDHLPGGVLRSMKGAEFLGDAVGLVDTIRREAPDVIHVHCTNQVALWLMWLLRRTGRPIVWTAHDVTPHESFAGADRVYKSIYEWSNALVAHSELDKRRLVDEFDIPGAKIHVIPHGDYQFFADGERAPDRAALRRAAGIADDAPTALFFGFIRTYKGLDLLLDAWPEVVERVPEARLVVAGDPARLGRDEFDRLRATADRLGVVHRFEYLPFEEVHDYLSMCDVLVLPYRKISQSGVLMLAMSVGLPVVATRVGAFPEVIESGRTGILIDPGSGPALVDALGAVLADGALRERLGDAGREQAARRFSWDAIAASTESLFRSMAEESK